VSAFQLKCLQTSIGQRDCSSPMMEPNEMTDEWLKSIIKYLYLTVSLGSHATLMINILWVKFCGVDYCDKRAAFLSHSTNKQ
jgi:hypothetical protein